jgi:hypothetical protein
MRSLKLGFTGALFLALGGFFLLLVLNEIARNSLDSSFPIMGFFSFLVIGLGLYCIVQTGIPETKQTPS